MKGTSKMDIDGMGGGQKGADSVGDSGMGDHRTIDDRPLNGESDGASTGLVHIPLP